MSAPFRSEVGGDVARLHRSRSRLAHNDPATRRDLVWETARTDLPRLREQLQHVADRGTP